LPDDSEAEEAATEQRALLASFETRRRDEAARHFLVSERRVAVERVAEAQATARALDHRCNVEAARAMTEQRLNEEDRRGALAEALVRRRAIAVKASTP
jgi:hypothetical protein